MNPAKNDALVHQLKQTLAQRSNVNTTPQTHKPHAQKATTPAVDFPKTSPVVIQNMALNSAPKPTVDNTLKTHHTPPMIHGKVKPLPAVPKSVAQPKPQKMEDTTTTTPQHTSPKIQPQSPESKNLQASHDYEQQWRRHFADKVGHRADALDVKLSSGDTHAVVEDNLMDPARRLAKVPRSSEAHPDEFFKTATAVDQKWDAIQPMVDKAIQLRASASAEEAQKVQAWCKSSGVTQVLAMQQKDHLTAEKDFRTSEGVCQGASYEWARTVMKEPSMLSKDTGGQITDETRRLQIAHARNGDSQSGVYRLTGGMIPDEVTAQDGLKEKTVVRVDTPPHTSFGQWVEKNRGALADTNGVGLLKMDGADRGSHAIAFQVSKDSVRFYDVNQGLFEMPRNSKTDQNLNAYLTDHYPDFKSFAVLSYPKA